MKEPILTKTEKQQAYVKDSLTIAWGEAKLASTRIICYLCGW